MCIRDRNVAGLIMFIIILLLFTVGGYFFMNYMLNDFSKENNETEGITELPPEVWPFRFPDREEPGIFPFAGKGG